VSERTRGQLEGLTPDHFEEDTFDTGFNVLKNWLIRNRKWVHVGSAVLLGSIGVLVVILEQSLGTSGVDHGQIAIIAILVPSAISLIVIYEIALAW
jgi:hypothetical protein